MKVLPIQPLALFKVMMFLRFPSFWFGPASFF